MAAESAAPAEPAPDNAAFIAELRPALVAFFRRRCGTLAEAEDLAQETIARAGALGLDLGGPRAGLHLSHRGQPLARPAAA